MIQHMLGWLRAEARVGRARGRWARWIGRNWARMSYGYRVEPTWLEVNRFKVPIANLAPAFAGFRIVQLSDFHCSRQVTPAYLSEAVHLAPAPHGVFAVLGNHDFSVRNALGFRRYRHLHRAVASALSSHGIRVLHNECVCLGRQGATLHLIGVEDLWSRVCDLDSAFADLPASAPRVVLAHNPRTVEHLGDRRCDLMLSGHTHGGQVHLPGLGRPTLRPGVWQPACTATAIRMCM